MSCADCSSFVFHSILKVFPNGPAMTTTTMTMNMLLQVPEFTVVDGYLKGVHPQIVGTMLINLLIQVFSQTKLFFWETLCAHSKVNS